MSHKFSQKLLIRIFFLTIFIACNFFHTLRAQTTPGVLDSLEKIIGANQSIESDLELEYKDQATIFSKAEVKKLKGKILINPKYLQAKILKSPSSFFLQERNLKCDFLEQVWLGLHSNDLSKRITIPIIVEEDGKKTKYNASSKVIAEHLSKENCLQSYTLIKSIRSTGLKEVVNNFISDSDAFDAKNNTQCSQSYEKIKKSTYLNFYFYLSRILKASEKIDSNNLSTASRKIILKAKMVEEKLSSRQSQVLKNLSSTLHSYDSFCQNISQKNIFTVLTNKKRIFSNYLEALCRKKVLKKGKVTGENLSKCINFLEKNPNSCSVFKDRALYSLYPQQDCSEQVTNLVHSRETNIVPDCPGYIMNEAVINSARILTKLEKTIHNKKDSYQLNGDIRNCFQKSLNRFVKHGEKFFNKTPWNVYSCYVNKESKLEQCYQTIFINDKKNEKSIANVVSNILNESRTTKFRPDCRFIPRQKFEALGVKKSRGCHIAYDATNCFFEYCPFKVYLNGRKIPDFIQIKGKPKFKYFQSNTSDKQLSFHQTIKKEFKLKESKVYNLTQFQEILKRKIGTVHGIGCSEDFLPNQFIRRTFNQCSPLPFIITGLRKRETALTDFVLVNLSIDTSINVRAYNWKSIDTAVKNFQRSHPNQAWNLYALYY